MVHGTRRKLLRQAHIKRIDLARLKSLQRPGAEYRQHVAQQLAVTLAGTCANFATAATRTADREPMLDPVLERDPVRVDVFADIAGMQQPAELGARFRFAAVKGRGVATAADGIAQPPNTCAARVNIAVAPTAMSDHSIGPSLFSNADGGSPLIHVA
jgi:hypothetical protein